MWCSLVRSDTRLPTLFVVSWQCRSAWWYRSLTRLHLRATPTTRWLGSRRYHFLSIIFIVLLFVFYLLILLNRIRLPRLWIAAAIADSSFLKAMHDAWKERETNASERYQQPPLHPQGATVVIGTVRMHSFRAWGILRGQVSRRKRCDGVLARREPQEGCSHEYHHHQPAQGPDGLLGIHWLPAVRLAADRLIASGSTCHWLPRSHEYLGFDWLPAVPLAPRPRVPQVTVQDLSVTTNNWLQYCIVVKLINRNSFPIIV